MCRDPDGETEGLCVPPRITAGKLGAWAQSLLTFTPSTKNQDTPKQSTATYGALQPPGRCWGSGTGPGGRGCAGSPHQRDTWAPAAASAAASAAAALSCAAAAVCRMLITGTMRQRKSGRSGTMSRLRGLSQARRDRGRICRPPGPGRRLLCGGVVRGLPSAPGRRAGGGCPSSGSRCSAPTPERPLSLCGCGRCRKGVITGRRNLPDVSGEEDKGPTAGTRRQWLPG